jgi:hypothetical protein
MALLFSDGFDSYAAIGDLITCQKYVSNANGATLAATAGKFGGQALAVGAYYTPAGMVTRSLGLSTANALYFGFWYKQNGLPNGDPSGGYGHSGLGLPNTTGANETLLSIGNGIGQTGALALVQLGSGSTVLARGSAIVTDNAWHWIEVGIQLSTTSSGWAKVYVDSILQINYTGVTMSNVTLTGALQIAAMQNQNGGVSAWYDDFIFYDSTGSNADFNGTNFPLGPRRISLLVPNADGDTTQFTPLSGTSHYAMVNGGYASTNYVSDSNTGDIDLYKFPALPYLPAKVNAVVASYWAQNSGGGSATLTPKIKTGGTVGSGTSVSLPTSNNTLIQQTFYTDASGAAWSGSSVNAMQAGMGD